MPASRPHVPVLRLAQLIRRFAVEEGSYNRLEQRIREANERHYASSGLPKKLTVDRRKLQSLGKNVTSTVISIDEIIALETYLDVRGESLAHHPLLRKPDMLHTLAQSTDLVFLLGARFDAIRRRVNVAVSDVLAMTEIQSGVSRFSSQVQLDFRDVPLKENEDEANAVLGETCDDIFTNDGPSIVSVGSPRACHASERMLAEMFGYDPFQPGEVSGLPFHLVWPEVDWPDVPSVAHLHGHQLEPQFEEQRKSVSEGARALHTGDKVLLAEPSDWPRSRDLGVICCQRRAQGQIWACVAGLSGAATLAAALALNELDVSLPHPREVGEHSEILWAVVQAQARSDKPRSGLAIKRALTRGIEGPVQMAQAVRVRQT